MCLWENPHTFVMHAMLTQVSCIVPVGEPIFEPFPHEVTFQAYEPYKTYEARLRLRNNDAVRMCSFVRVCVCVCVHVSGCVSGYKCMCMCFASCRLIFRVI